MMKTMKRAMIASTVLMTMLNGAWAMQALDDHGLAEATGQDGLTIGLHGTGKITFDSISIEDTDGFRTIADPALTTHNNRAALNYVTANPNTGIAFYNGTSLITTPIVLAADAIGGADPSMNIAITFPNLTRIRLEEFKVSIGTLAAGVIDPVTERTLLKTGTGGIDIDFKSGSPLVMNVQLGNTPQGAMFKFGGALEKITANGLELVSYHCTANCPTPASPNTGTYEEDSSIKLDFSLSAHGLDDDDPAVVAAAAFNLDLYGKVSENGLEIGNTGTLDKFDLKINNLTFGDMGTFGAAFDGLKNGSIGNIGMTGVAVTGLKATVRGM